jgi:hypothetical protein
MVAALDRVVTAFATDPGKADILALARLAERMPDAMVRSVADALTRATMRADVGHRVAIARCLTLDLKPHPELRLARLLASMMAGVMAAVPSVAPVPAPPAPPPAPPSPP